MKKVINLSYLMIGLFLLFLAVSLYYYKIQAVHLLAQALGLVLILFGSWKALEGLFANQAPKKIPTIFDKPGILGWLEIILGSFIFFWNDYSALALTYLIGAYQFLMAVVGLLAYYLLWRDQAPKQWSQLIQTGIHLLFAFSSLFLSSRIDHTLTRLSLYLFFLAGTYFYDGLNLTNRIILTYQKRNIRMPLPIIWTVLMPYQMLQTISRWLDRWDSGGQIFLKQLLDQADAQNPVNLEIYIHTSPYGFDRIGHADFAYKDKVYSYGNHDAESRKLFDMVGDGVFLLADRQAYIKWLTQRRVTIISFGLHLSQAECQALEDKLQALNQWIYEFDLETAKQLETFVGVLSQEVDLQLYKFKSGQFKTYFVLGTNCVSFVDFLLWQSGLDILAFTGIMTPGTYYDYLNKEYQKTNSKIVSKKVYNQQVFSKQRSLEYGKSL